MERLQIEPDWLWRMSLDRYHQMIDHGVLGEDDKVELLEGYIVAMSPQSPEHARIVKRLTKLLFASVGDRYEIGPQTPLTLARSEPEPDLAVYDPKLHDQGPRHPNSAHLVIEVSVDSLKKDLGVKVRLYAEAGILEYWVIDVENRRVHVFRDPDPPALVYRSTQIVDGGSVASTALPALSVELGSLFAL